MQILILRDRLLHLKVISIVVVKDIRPWSEILKSDKIDLFFLWSPCNYTDETIVRVITRTKTENSVRAITGISQTVGSRDTFSCSYVSHPQTHPQLEQESAISLTAHLSCMLSWLLPCIISTILMIDFIILQVHS